MQMEGRAAAGVGNGERECVCGYVSGCVRQLEVSRLRRVRKPQRKQRDPTAGKAIATPEPTAKEAGAESDGSEAAKNIRRRMGYGGTGKKG